VTDWKNATSSYLAAGNGWVKFGMDKIEETTVASCGFSYKCDREASSGNGIYLRPARSLKNGDIIMVKAYCTSTPTDSKRYGMGIYADGGTTALSAQYIPNDMKNIEVELTYTISAGDGLAGKDLIVLYREDNSVFLTEVHITGDASAEPASREIVCHTAVTVTVPDLNANGKQDWIYVSASAEPQSVTNAVKVTDGTNGPDANTDNQVSKYKVTAEGDATFTFPMNTRIYKIGVTHILKEIHPVGGVGWATESRDHSIDHALTGYFTVNDVNAYTVNYDSYDMKTTTVALTPIVEDGYVAENTGTVLRLDNGSTDSGANLTKANSEESLYRIPLFYPSYTLGASSTPTTFPADNLMYPNLTKATHQYENSWIGGNTYTKFILTNVHWTYHIDHTLNADESAGSITETDAAGFYRMHIWSTTDDKDTKNTMPANTAYLLVPTDNLPLAVWAQQSSGSAARRNTIGIRTAWGETTDIDKVDMDSLRKDEDSAEGRDGDWYTLNGMKLAGRPTKAGVYIRNGKKIIK
jgi:hypothetical protein